jgi:glycosyltransferase involved in cell wall biosynthesis
MNGAVDNLTSARPSRRRCLVVSPVIPALEGAGIAMRIGWQIRVLATFFDVTLAVVVDDATEPEVRVRLPADIRNICNTVIVICEVSPFERSFRRLTGVWGRLFEASWPVPRSFGRCQRGIAQLAKQLTNEQFDVVHCFRLATAKLPHALRHHGIGYLHAVLDLDDYESHAKFRAVRSLRSVVGTQYFLLRGLEAMKWMVLESMLIPRFDQVYICSEPDRAILRRRFIHPIFFVLPNIVATPPGSPPSAFNRVFTFLFVGQLNYSPNVDGILYFLRAVLPILRRVAPAPFHIRVIGREPDKRIVQLAELQGVEVIANPTSVDTFYRGADAAIVPLRAGGGTRIKILEAFSYSLPVVSTAIGAEGIEVTPEQDILIADDPGEFARQCARLMADAGLHRRIGEAGHRLFRGRYTEEALVAALRLAYATAGILDGTGQIRRNIG